MAQINKYWRPILLEATNVFENYEINVPPAPFEQNVLLKYKLPDEITTELKGRNIANIIAMAAYDDTIGLFDITPCSNANLHVVRTSTSWLNMPLSQYGISLLNKSFNFQSGDELFITQRAIVKPKSSAVLTQTVAAVPNVSIYYEYE